MKPSATSSAVSRRIVLSALVGLFCWFFADALFRCGMFAFRDAGHFYYPLFRLIRDEWAAGRVPLWNPYENLGQPLAADATASVFYPGKLIFALPLGYAWAYKLYVMGHVLLAAGAAYALARYAKASVLAAGICAASYAFGGNVLFDYCNVVFLIGAAWLPVAMWAAAKMLCERRSRWAIMLGLVLALMVLGGDPQMAYNAGLLTASYSALLWWRERVGQASRVSLWERVRHFGPLSLWERVRVRVRSVLPPHRAPFSPAVAPTAEAKPAGTVMSYAHPSPLREGAGKTARPRRTSRCLLLALAAATAFLLAAIQILPSLELTYYSNRVAGRPADRLLGRLEPESHLDYVYRFSVGPWRLAEYLWPNCGGRQFPVNRRWLDVLPAEGHPWTPSLYMGVLPFLLALSSLRLRGGSTRDVWLSWSVVLAVVAGFGYYGLGWIGQEIAAAIGWPGARVVGPPFGGLYWLMTLLLPGYVCFRYPAKLLVIAALGLSALAARGWDRTVDAPTEATRLRRWLLWLAVFSAVGVAAALLLRPLATGWLSAAKPDMLLGPLQAFGALGDLVASLAQTAVLCGAFWWLFRERGRRERGRESFFCGDRLSRLAKAVGGNGHERLPAIALLLVAIDLAAANGWMIVCAPASQWEQPSAVAAAIERQEIASQTFPCRLYRHPLWTPPAWQAVSSAARLTEAARWDRDTLWPKYNLPARLALADVPGSLMLRDYERYLASAGPPERLCEAVAAEYAILPGDQILAGGKKIKIGAGVEDASLWRLPQPMPRAWIVYGLHGGGDAQSQLFLPSEEGRGEGAPQSPGLLAKKNAAATALTLTLSQRERGPEEIALSQRERGPEEIAFSQRERGPEEITLSERRRGPEGTLLSQGERGSNSSCRVSYYDPLRVEVEATLTRPGLVVLAEQFYPGWQLDVYPKGQAARRVSTLRVNEVMRGAWLPAGEHRLVYRYRPASFFWGALLSALGWVALAACVLWERVRN